MSPLFNRDGYYTVKTKSEMPTEPHYAIIGYESFYIPGDERSRTNPGHGYPASTEYVVTYKVFENREVWEAYISLNKSSNITPVYTIPAKIKVETKVLVDLPRHA
jgi:hypothetical protein